MQTPHTADTKRHGIPKMVSAKELSELIGIHVHTLYNWRHKGEGPPSFRLCGSVKYLVQDVAAWIEEELRAKV